MATNTNQTIAFFGATGDCAGFCLAATLNAGRTCRALARTPNKLIQSLEAKSVSAETIDKHLTIVKGNVKDVEAVKRTLQLPNGDGVDKIVSGIGGTPTLQWSILRPVVITDATICQDAGGCILKALQDLKPARKPLFINVSTTGIPPEGAPRDVPIAFGPLYHWLLVSPHEDKMVLEEKLREHVSYPEAHQAISGFVNVKPSLLMDGPGKGLGLVRQGTDMHPAVGYTIQRKDVGEFMAQKLVIGEVGAEYLNKSLSITY